MSNLLQLFKIKIEPQYIKKWYITYLITLVNFAVFNVLAFLDFNLKMETLAWIIAIIYSFSESCLIIPCSLIFYGVISYNATKKIIIPNILLFISLGVIVLVIAYLLNQIAFLGYLALLRLLGIMIAVSLVASIITAVWVKIYKNSNK